ncbi:hypothetical protein N7478_009888 [Penicillium angulare]|uniref:uncharacterized protein n=1 Tax=Penicillium angulare TaxID=116970 RepID=UPI00253FFA16|nr:uncharacterized protein N7478_009888 [Penicillium angulare]KAJ5267080.1 hypothetical protein N7478_009888 [Penicillium angulare]
MDGSQRPETMRSHHSDSSDFPRSSSAISTERVGKEDVMITLSVSPEPPAPPRTRSPLARSHLRSRSLVGIPGMPSMTRAYSSPGLDSRGRYIFVNGRGAPATSADGAKRTLPLQMRADDHIETRMGSLNISETISENAELETMPKSPSSQSGSSPVLMPQTFPRIDLSLSNPRRKIQRSLSCPFRLLHFIDPVNSDQPSISEPEHFVSETIPDIPDAEAEAVEDDDRIAQLKAAADAEAASNNHRRRGTSDVSSTSSFNTMRAGRKRWSVCGAERRQDLDLETIWED